MRYLLRIWIFKFYLDLEFVEKNIEIKYILFIFLRILNGFFFGILKE